MAIDHIIIRAYQTGDEQVVIALFEQVFNQIITPAQWQWKYKGTGTAGVHSQLVFDAENRLLGHAGAIPLRGYLQGKPIPFFQICDVMVHPTARGHLGPRNLFTTLLRRLLGVIASKHPEAFCYGFPGRRPFLLGERVRVYDKIEFAVELTRQPRLLTFPLLRVRRLDWSNPALDQLWARLLPWNALLLARDGAYLRWRYAQNPVHRYTLLGFFGLGRLLGWAVTRRSDERLLIVDLLCKRSWLGLILRALDQVAATTGAQTVHIWLPEDWRAGGSGDQHVTEVVVSNMLGQLPLATSLVKDSLYYTMGDLDIF
ncbi:MAG: GNAT family N-acetyltransferase [Candidatus Competibacteraceae bacterium]|jgi:hypothetical protein|nr:GNAT family N-acetyltransferase [Candidatus Competibacteraceae bacterium]